MRLRKNLQTILLQQSVARRTGAVYYDLKDAAYDTSAIKAHSLTQLRCKESTQPGQETACKTLSQKPIVSIQSFFIAEVSSRTERFSRKIS